MSILISGRDLGAKVADALGLKNTRRIILDMSLDDVCLVYVEMIGDDRLYEIDFNGAQYEIKESVIEYCKCLNKPINPIYHVTCNVCDKPHKEEMK